MYTTYFWILYLYVFKDLYTVPEDPNFPMKSHVTVESVGLCQVEDSMLIVWMGI